MALSTYPAVSSPVKSVQRGAAAGAGTVTITAVDIAKSMVNIFGTTSSGTVSASFGLTTTNAGGSILTANSRGASNTVQYTSSGNSLGVTSTGYANIRYNSAHARVFAVSGTSSHTINSGSTNLVAAVVQGYLSGSTSLVVSGACRYEVVEFN